jgi:predicted alpha/beta hydrolase family esterase
MNHTIIVHGWGDNPDANWLPWMKGELEGAGWQVDIPAMPDTEMPVIEAWVSYLAKTIGTPSPELYLVGHSIGCQTVLRYLMQLEAGQEVGGAVLVAPFLRLDPIGVEYTAEEKAIVQPWVDAPVDLRAAASHLVRGSVAIFSDNDYWVSATYNEPRFRDELGAKTIILPSRGHFMARDGATTLPEALSELAHLAT